MKVIIIGIPYFAQKLQQQLLLYDTQNKYIFLNMYHKKIDKLKYLFHILNCDVVYIHGGNLSGKSKVVNLALKLNKKIIMNWAGTDVLNAMRLVNNNNFDVGYIDNITHLCETPWIQNELIAIGINAKITPIAITDKCIIKKIKIPSELKVLTYIGQDRPEFYGMKTIMKLANDFPSIEFRIAGLDSYPNIPNNITLLGWTDMDKEYKECLVYIRTPEHDGLGFSVLESLCYGRIVFRNYNFPSYVNYFKDYNDLKEQFEKVIDDFNNNRLDINYKAIEYIKEEFSKEKVLRNLIKVFNAK